MAGRKKHLTTSLDSVAAGSSADMAGPDHADFERF